MTERNLAVGLAAGLGVLLVWSSFMVFSRMGATSALTAYDLAGLRFIVAGAVTAPFALAWWPRELGWRRAAILAITGPGAIYTLMMYVGLGVAPAAYGGVFANGSLPLFAMAVAWITAGERPGPRRIAASLLLLGGGVLVAWPGLGGGGLALAGGLALFVCASALLSVYIRALDVWAVTPKGALAVVNLPNLVIFLPIWVVFLPKGLAEASNAEIAFQALFQGLGPGFLAVILFTLTARHLGAAATAGISATVPAGAALLAAPVLGEALSALEWLGVGLVTLGLATLVLRRLPKA